MKGRCGVCKIVWILIVIGGLNWGLHGLGMLIGTNLDVVNLIFGSIPKLEAVIYLIVGLATLMKIFGKCKCGSCKMCETGNAQGMPMNK